MARAAPEPALQRACRRLPSSGPCALLKLSAILCLTCAPVYSHLQRSTVLPSAELEMQPVMRSVNSKICGQCWLIVMIW